MSVRHVSHLYRVQLERVKWKYWKIESSVYFAGGCSIWGWTGCLKMYINKETKNIFTSLRWCKYTSAILLCVPNYSFHHRYISISCGKTRTNRDCTIFIKPIRIRIRRWICISCVFAFQELIYSSSSSPVEFSGDKLAVHLSTPGIITLISVRPTWHCEKQNRHESWATDIKAVFLFLFPFSFLS